GAPILATLGSASVQVALGDKVDWVKVAIDVAVGLILGKFGGKLSNGIYNRVMEDVAVRTIGRAAFGRILATVITTEASRVFTTAVNADYTSLRGKDVTWESFVDQLVDRLTDPRGLAVAVLMGAVTAYGERKSFDEFYGVPKPPSQVKDFEQVDGRVVKNPT